MGGRGVRCGDLVTGAEIGRAGFTEEAEGGRGGLATEAEGGRGGLERTKEPSLPVNRE